MKVFYTIEDLRQELNGKAVSFVPTMGALHQGHIELVKEARAKGLPVVFSIYVNPMQFGKGEDFTHYPRTLSSDITKLEGLADYIFAPDNLYSSEQTIAIEPTINGDILCGQYRNGHFTGVLTVVAKLFNIVNPTFAFFGEKDWQQLYLIKQMAKQLDFPIEVIGVPIHRESDGLAMSSRNIYLSQEQRQIAPLLYAAIVGAKNAITNGEETAEILEAIKSYLDSKGFSVQYLEHRGELSSSPRVFVAAYLGTTRLIDNC
jgi:pantoate--beta-alanine ligase